MAPTKARLLRLAIAHYRNPAVSDSALHKFVQTDHAVKAARVHEKYNLAAYRFVFTPSPFRDVLTKACHALQNGWIVDDRELTVEFYFRDLNELFKVALDPSFQAIQAEEKPYIRSDEALASMGWVETYIENGRIVNVDDKGSYTYGDYAEQSQIELKLPGA